MREKVGGAMRSLPPNVLPPRWQKADPDSDPIITLAVSGDRPVARTDRDRRQAGPARARNRGRRRQRVDITGGRYRQINICMDLDKLSRLQPDARRMSERRSKPRTSRRPAAASCAERPRSASAPWAAWTRSREFNDIIIKNVGGSPIRVRDIGYAEDGMAEKRSFAYYKGKPGGHSRSAAPERAPTP